MVIRILKVGQYAGITGGVSATEDALDHMQSRQLEVDRVDDEGMCIKYCVLTQTSCNILQGVKPFVGKLLP